MSEPARPDYDDIVARKHVTACAHIILARARWLEAERENGQADLDRWYAKYEEAKAQVDALTADRNECGARGDKFLAERDEARAELERVKENLRVTMEIGEVHRGNSSAARAMADRLAVALVDMRACVHLHNTRVYGLGDAEWKGPDDLRQHYHVTGERLSEYRAWKKEGGGE
jgi:malate synthase